MNGSARLRLGDGSITYLGFGGTNGHEYTSLGRTLKAQGLVRGPVTIEAIREAYRRNPAAVTLAMRQNKRFVFFRETDAEGWPSGSLGFQVEPRRSLATDKSIFPRGGFVFVDTFVNGNPLPSGCWTKTPAVPFRSGPSRLVSQAMEIEPPLWPVNKPKKASCITSS